MRSFTPILLAIVAVEFTAPLLAQAPIEPLPPSRLTAAEIKALVDFHNAARAEVGAPPLRWSAQLGARAQQWADHLAATGTFEHRPIDPEATKFYGENLAIASFPGYSPLQATQSWYAEKADYTPGTPIPENDPEFKAGHYTQMVWSTTTEIGAGKAVLTTGDMADWTVVVANYAPPGNAVGEMPFSKQGAITTHPTAP